ncbi:Zinc-type alcohol dehydrogenase-like protein [Tolypocladium ophioglossoides CBS 100239]|uniref:Zinc-type alcohol dehydrogenase-like protein n=1 Tax=Tolypocladium ophioglossoides (strain CBS 100239) TaxID=1163406 RepID=A0A0L0N5E8_TOLOC|nr:Zinc-type alcohol dehydrogenase-like protein [Tolypocladium ophioglossoides CBS 100239]
MLPETSAVTMKALQLIRERPEEAPRLVFATVPKPKLIPHHVLVRVHASAIHPSDILNAQGLFPHTQYPRIVGRDYAGIIEEGPQHLVGLEVYGTSGHSYAFTEDGFQAEYCLVHENDFAQKPKNITFTQAATVGIPFTTAALTIERTAVRPSDTVLVIGSNGSVGSSIVQLAMSKGARVLKASRHDMEDGINTKTDPEMTTLDILTGGRGVDVVIDTVGSPALIRNALKKLTTGGRLAFISAPKEGSTELGVDMLACYRSDITLHGCNSLNQSAQEMARRMEGLGSLFESRRLLPQGNWTPVPLNRATGAYEALLNKSSTEKFLVVMD